MLENELIDGAETNVITPEGIPDKLVKLTEDDKFSVVKLVGKPVNVVTDKGVAKVVRPEGSGGNVDNNVHADTSKVSKFGGRLLRVVSLFPNVRNFGPVVEKKLNEEIFGGMKFSTGKLNCISKLFRLGG
jgi:hypothetical protein